ncbi:MAG: hypothetical protein NTW57_08495 [Methylophilales bacterium]|jgi:antitoxin (DNA-binding transcriptional repressor) of toxin-antitoxin stability system|nr:hypothetical protein [Methylophilales bacterium]
MRVSMQEFKSHLAQYVVQAQNGQLIELTSHRKVVAKVVGVPSTATVGIANLLAGGAACWQGGKPKGAALNLVSKGKLVSSLVMEDRE